MNRESERIVELERRLFMARDHLVAEVRFSTELCAKFEDDLTRMNVELSRLQRQRGLYWRVRSRLGRAFRRLSMGPR